jgi:hypothetical protein
MKKRILIATLCLAGSLAAACSSTDQTASKPTTTPTLAQVSPTLAPSPTVVKTENKTHTDGSEIVVKHHSDGSKHEHRTFKKGPLVSVTRKTHADGTATAHAVHRDDNTEAEITEKPWVEKAMDATGDALAKAAKKSKDIGEKVGDEAKKDVKAIGKGLKKVGEKVKKAVE